MGHAPILRLTASVFVLAVLGMALLPLSVPGFMFFGAVAGLATPPIQPAVRTIYPKLVNSTQLTPLFSLDASLQEIIWILAPVAITFVSTQVGTVEGLLMVAAILISAADGSSPLPRPAAFASPAAAGASAECS